MAPARAALAVAAAVAVAVVFVSGGSGADPRTPAALPGQPTPFLGTAVIGGGELTAAIDAYGDVVDLRSPGPAGTAQIENPAAAQASGSVPAATGIVPRIAIAGALPLALWDADAVRQRYLPGSNAVRTVAGFGRARVVVTEAIRDDALAVIVDVRGPRRAEVAPRLDINLEPRSGLRCRQSRHDVGLALSCGPAPALPPARLIVRGSTADDRRWLSRARGLGPGAPAWARSMYRRSLLTLRALTDRRSGAVAAGARDGWAHVWPRDAGTVALALSAAGYRREARRVARFLLGLDLGAAARFDGDGAPLQGREAQGDADGWVAVAASAAGIAPTPTHPREEAAARPNRADYQEGSSGAFLANAIAASQETAGGAKSPRGRAAARIEAAFATRRGLAREADDPGSGLDSAAAWAVRPFALPALFPAARRTLLGLAARQTRFGIVPSESWDGDDPWMAPTAWSAWSLAALGERGEALRLLGDLRRAATPAGALPERVDAATGIPRSTTPLAWPHAFAILALRQLWPQR